MIPAFYDEASDLKKGDRWPRWGQDMDTWYGEDLSGDRKPKPIDTYTPEDDRLRGLWVQYRTMSADRTPRPDEAQLVSLILEIADTAANVAASTVDYYRAQLVDLNDVMESNATAQKKLVHIAHEANNVRYKADQKRGLPAYLAKLFEEIETISWPAS